MDQLSVFVPIAVLLGILLGPEVKVARAATELLKNPDFEYTNVSRDWNCNGKCTLETSRDSYSHFHSILVSNRPKQYNGPAQNVQVTPGKNYKFVAFIKLLSLPSNAMYDRAELMMTCNTPSNQHVYLKFGDVPYIQKDVWTEIGGIHNIPSGTHNCHIYVQVKHPETNYLLDDASLQEFPDDPNWLSEANARIENIRKANIKVTLNGPSTEQYDVELKQTSQEFAFGTAVGASQLVDPAYKNYHDFIFNNFEWAVLENALKWTQLERTHNHVDYSKAMAAITELRNGGIKVRAHNLVWAMQQHSPTWLQHMSDSQIKTEMEAHIADAVTRTKGLVEHWDVNNENLHGDWYEQVTHDPNITMKMFDQAHRIDPHVKLFLNDYAILGGSMAMAMRDQAKLFADSHVPLYGVGLQSHIHDPHPNMAVYKEQLDTVAEAGLPIWITELSVAATDANTKAAALKDLMTLYFSHPSVEGVLLWGFWDGKLFDKAAALFEGPNITPNAAGSVYQTLFHSTWRTDEHHTVSGQGSVAVRGFRGQYELIVKHKGQMIANETFQVHAAGKTVTVNVGTGSANVIVG